MREQEINSILSSLAVEIARITAKSETVNAIEEVAKKIQARIAEIACIAEETRYNFYSAHLRIDDVFYGLEKRVEMLRSMLDVNKPDSLVLARVENDSIKTIYSKEFFNFDALYAEIILDVKSIYKTLKKDLKKNAGLMEEVDMKNKAKEQKALEEGHAEMKRWVADAIRAQLFLFHPARSAVQIADPKSQVTNKIN